MPVVFVPGKGNIQFPDNMTPYQINLIIEREILPGKKPETISAPKPPEASLTNILKGVGENFRLGLENVREAVSEITPGEYIESGLVNAGRILAAPRIIQNKMFEAAGITPKAPPPPPRQGPRISERIDEVIGLGSPQERARRAAEEARRAQIYGAAAVRSPGEQRRLSQQAEAAAAKPEFESILGEGLYSGATSLAQMTPGIAASLLTRSTAPALASAGMMSAADQYFNVLDRGGTRQEALDAAQLTGATEVATELLPMAAVVKNLGKVGVAKFLREYLGKDLPTELLATITQNAIDTAIANPEKTWSDYLSELPSDLATTAVSTLVPGAALAATGKGLEVASRLAERGAPEEEVAAALGAPPPPGAPPAAPRAPAAPPQDLASSLGPVGGTVRLQEPDGVREYRFDGFDEDGSVLLTDEDGLTLSEDPAQISAALSLGVAESAEAPVEDQITAPPATSFGMDITEGLPEVEQKIADKRAALAEQEAADAAAEAALREDMARRAAAQPAPEAPKKPLPLAKDASAIINEYSQGRTTQELQEIMQVASEMARGYGKKSINKDVLFRAGQQVDRIGVPRTPAAPAAAPAAPAAAPTLGAYNQASRDYDAGLITRDEFRAKAGLPRMPGAPAPTPAAPVPAEMYEADAQKLNELNDFLERLDDDLSGIAETRAENAYEGEDPETQQAYEEEIAALQEALANTVAEIEAIKGRYAASAAPAPAEDLRPEVERIMGKFHPELRDAFILPGLEERVATGEPLTEGDIPDTLWRNLTKPERETISRVIQNNPQMLVDAGRSVPFTAPAGNVVEATREGEKKPKNMIPYVNTAITAMWASNGQNYKVAGAKRPEWVPGDEQDHPPVDLDFSLREGFRVDVKFFKGDPKNRLAAIYVTVPTVDAVHGPRGNTAGAVLWLRNVFPANMEYTLDTLKTLSDWLGDPENANLINTPQGKQRLNSIVDQALQYLSSLGGETDPGVKQYTSSTFFKPTPVPIQSRQDVLDYINEAIDEKSSHFAGTIPDGVWGETEAAVEKKPAPAPEAVRTVTTPGGSKVEVAFEVVEAEDLKAATGQLQNRQRSRASTDIQVQDIISKFDPQRLGESLESDRGSPIIGPDNVVESGNGRVMALNRIYDGHPEKAEAYKKFIESQGFDVSGMKRPVLVRRRISEMTMDDRAQFVRESNMDTKLALSTSERAGTDAASLTPDVMGLLRVPDVAAAANRDFVRAFLAKLPAQEQGGFFDKSGDLSAEGIRRIRTAIKAAAYDDVDLINTLEEAQDNNIKSIGGALEDVAAPWRRLRDAIADGDVLEEMDVTPQLVEAAKIVRDVRNRGEKINDFLAQQDAFNPLNPITERFIRAFYNQKTGRAAGREAIAEFLDKYARRAAEQTTGAQLIETESLSPEQILDGIMESKEGDLFLSLEPIPVEQQQDVIEEARKTPSLSRGVAKLIRQRDRGLIDDAEFSARVTELADFIEYMKDERNYRVAKKGRVRGADRILEVLLAAKRRGEISPEAVDFMTWAINGNPNLANGLAISIRKTQEDVGAGEYDPVRRMMMLFKNRASDTTAVHELLHHTERMMPEEAQRAIRAAWLKALNKESDKHTQPSPLNSFFKAIRAFHSQSKFQFGNQTLPPRKGYDIAMNLLASGNVPYSYYQYVNPSEFWAVNATDIMQKRYDVKGSTLARMRNWLSELVEKAKGLFGLSSKSPIIKALDSLAKADGKFNSLTMLQEEGAKYMDTSQPEEGQAGNVVDINAKRNAEIMDVARAISKDPKVANLRQLEGIIDLLDDVYSSPDKALSNEAARIQDQLMEVESQLRAGKTPINDNVLETELQKAEREYDKIRDEYNKFFYNPDDERAFADRRTKEHKAWRKEADAFEAKLEAAGQKFEELYRQETDRLAEKVKHGSADEMKKAVAKGQKQDDKIMQERSDLQKDNRGCD